MHYCASEDGCGHDCGGRACPWAPVPVALPSAARWGVRVQHPEYGVLSLEGARAADALRFVLGAVDVDAETVRGWLWDALHLLAVDVSTAAGTDVGVWLEVDADGSAL